MKKHFISAVIAVASIITVACNQKTLVPLERSARVYLSYINVDAVFCTEPRETAKQKIKYIFILDHSESNQPGIPSALTPSDTFNTDPNGMRRYAPLVSFVNNLIPDPNNVTYFSLIDFQDTAYYPGTLTGFDASASDFVNTYVTPDWIGNGTAAVPVPNDHGFTNYTAALQMAYSLIQSDARSEALLPSNPIVTISYQIIFVSDGVPTVANPGGSAQPTYTQDFTADIKPVIDNIMNLKNDPTISEMISNISLNTAYYFQTGYEIAAAETLLSQMAAEGVGRYLQFGGGQSVAYQSFAPPVRNVKYNLSDVWTENQNVIGWDNGQIMLDSDGDGLPNDIEVQLGSDPYNADSDGNGVSDLVEYRTKGAPCNDANCAVANRDPYSICDGYSPTTSGTTVTFAQAGGDGLNLCEKFVLGANSTTFDSNGDFIPDLLSLKNSVPFIAGTNGAFLNPFGDQYNNYTKLKLGYPTTVSMSHLLSFQPRTNALTNTGSDSNGNSCYHYTSNHVAVMQAGNHIKVSLIENNALIDNKAIILNATKSWNGSDQTLYFTDGDFQ